MEYQMNNNQNHVDFCDMNDQFPND